MVGRGLTEDLSQKLIPNNYIRIAHEVPNSPEPTCISSPTACAGYFDMQRTNRSSGMNVTPRSCAGA
jgi:hypothetical protein